MSNAQVGIGITAPEAGLDITSTTTGLLIPRVALTSLLAQAPVLNPQTGNIPESTLVYHDGTGSINAGFYYWDGARWVLLTTTESTDWTVLGNNGITASNFIGTINAADFVVKTTNTDRMRILAAGNIGVGQAAPTASLDVKGNLIIGSSAKWSGSANAQANGVIIEGQTVIGADGSGDPTSLGFLTTYDSNTNNTAIAGITTAAASASSVGVYGVSGFDNTGVYGFNSATGTGVNGTTTGKGFGVYGTSGEDGLGVYGTVPGTGNGSGVYGYIPETATGYGTAVYGYNTSPSGVAGQFTVDNINATDYSVAAFVQYNGTVNNGTYGGGNALEVQHNGTNGNGFDIFMGDPTAAAGAANTITEYSAIAVSHMATGSSPNGTKNAISASSNSDDPTIRAVNSGTDNGVAIQGYVAPNAANFFRTAITGTSVEVASVGPPITFEAGRGVGVYGYGGWAGIYGQAASGSSWGIYSASDTGAAGAKSFVIDYPLDPANKTLRHYSVESNEVTNMYRGNVQLDNSGNATVTLPKYFSAINKNISYSLTGIGTPIHPYVSKEQENNMFQVSGAPNTKVSWVVYAKRNDPTIQYFNKTSDYDNEVSDKPAGMRGKYYTPEAYGLDATKGFIVPPANDIKKLKSVPQKSVKVKRKAIKTPVNPVVTKDVVKK